MKSSFISIVLLLLKFVRLISGHGRLMDPPARNAMWRFGFPNPVNYNDNELFCGGFAVQWEQNQGKCGVCGDPYQLDDPRPHEAGGTYAKGIISRQYSVGQVIDIEIELTANHYGKFEFYLCPNNNPSQEATQECFNTFPLYIAGTRQIAYYIPEDGKKKAIFSYQLQLPPYVTCTQCVIQWTYYTGNQWGMCNNGTEAVGCGRSETFRNCADVAIQTSTAGLPPLFVGSTNPYQLYYKDYSKPAPYNVFPLIIREQVCVPMPLYRVIPGLNEWCETNCLRYPPNCPKEVCECPNTCEAVGRHSGQLGADVQCMHDCLVYPGDRCNESECYCYEE